MNFEVEFEVEKERVRPQKSEVERLWADNSKAMKLLNWKPKYNNIKGFDKGINQTISWFENNKNINKYVKEGYVT